MLKILVPSVNNYLLQISQSVLPFQSSGEDHAVQEADEHSLPLLIKLNYKHLSFSVPVFNFCYKKTSKSFCPKEQYEICMAK